MMIKFKCPKCKAVLFRDAPKGTRRLPGRWCLMASEFVTLLRVPKKKK